MRTLTRRDFLRVGLGASGVAVLAACTPQVVKETVVVEREKVVEKTVVVEKVATAPAEKKHKIGFAWWTGGEGANKVFEEAVSRFELSHPNYTVTHMPISAEFTTKMLTMYGAGNAPDCHGVGFGTVWSWAHKGVLLDLTPLVERDAADVKWDDMWPAVSNSCFYPPKKICALPRETMGLLLYGYNKKIFEAAGVETPDKALDADTWTWQDWRAKAKAVTKLAGDKREIMGADQWLGYWDLQMIMPSYGVMQLNDKLTHYQLDDPKIVGYLKMLNEMTNTDRSLGKPDETKEFDWGAGGKQGLMYGATWGLPNWKTIFADFDWDFVIPPKGDCCYANLVGNDYHAVNGSKGADQEGGWELIKFLNSPTEDLWWALNMFGPPFRKGNLEAWTTKVAESLPKNGWKYVDKATQGAVPWTPIPFADELGTIVGNEIGQAVTGERPVDEVVQSIVTKADDMIAKFK